MIKKLLLIFSIAFLTFQLSAQYSVARRWNEVMLMAIRQDQARPPVQARNLFHVSLAMYDAWSVYKGYAKTYLIGKTVGGVLYPFMGIPAVASTDTVAFQEEALSYAAYRMLRERYQYSPNAFISMYRFDTLMQNLGYNKFDTATTYTDGIPAHLGNYIAAKVIEMGLNDGCNESLNYANQYYAPVNSPLNTSQRGSGNMPEPNRWQPLYIVNALDQNGFPTGSIQSFLSPEWGNGLPFCMPTSSANNYTRNGNTFKVYKDPGEPPYLSLTDPNDSSSNIFKWGHEMVAVWSAQLDPYDTTMIDISPSHIGNNSWYPFSFTDQKLFYDFFNGGDTSQGHPLNPATGLPYPPNMVRRGDYTRVVSQYWADGPTSETPPGHWFVLFNEVSDHPLCIKKYEGMGATLSDLEWDVKGYFTLGAAMHDAAVTCWGIKGWYDTPRPISALRKMAEYGQSSDSTLPNYHPAGLQLIPGYVELITATDSMAIANPSNLNKIKIKAWKGFSDLANPVPIIQTPTGVGWILAEDWMPYQRKTFVSPPFAGYTSGHSTYSRAGATVLSDFTGSPYFPGGLSEHSIDTSSHFLVFEYGPSSPLTMQWASYRDASDESSLSRIWGGIHPPFDDMRGRLIGEEIGNESHNLAKSYFEASFALPVQISFLNTTENNCRVSIHWSAAVESNTTYYEVWRSADGEHYDTRIAIINAKGVNIGEQLYTCIDASPLTQNYYKLISFDTENHKSEHQTSFIRMDNCGENLMEQNVAVFPNPVNDQLNINLNSNVENQQVNFTVSDLTGKMIIRQSFQTNSQHETFVLPTTMLKSGNYLLNVLFEDGQKNILKFTKE